MIGSMPKRLPDKDFRAHRRVLNRRDFAYAPKPQVPPSDAVGKSTWDGIVTLPDDVAVRTSNHHGSTLAQLESLWGAWIESIGEVQDCLSPAMLEAADDFQSSTYTALTGFYRLSITALRSALELTTIASWAQVCSKETEYRAWRSGKTTLSFGQACDGLIGATRTLQEQLRVTVSDTLFNQETHLVKAASLAGFSTVCRTFHTHAQAALTGTFARVMVQSTCRRSSITWPGCILRR